MEREPDPLTAGVAQEAWLKSRKLASAALAWCPANEYNDADRNRVPHTDRILREQAWDESILVPASHRTDIRPARARLTIIYTGRKRFVTLRVAPQVVQPNQRRGGKFG